MSKYSQSKLIAPSHVMMLAHYCGSESLITINVQKGFKCNLITFHIDIMYSMLPSIRTLKTKTQFFEAPFSIIGKQSISNES